MWRYYFGPKCHIYGVDIAPECKAYENDNTRIFIGDQADRNFWHQVRSQVPRLDILIDDGGHQPREQIITLEEVFPHLQPGGVYLCEDIHGTWNDFTSYVQGLTQNIHAFNLQTPPAFPVNCPAIGSPANEFQAMVNSIHQYPFVVVLEKRQARRNAFVAPKHGTQWQPFMK